MNIHVYPNDLEASAKAAGLIIEQVRNKPDSLFSLAAGSTPLKTFSLLVEAVRQGKADFDQCRFASLDEWVGLDGSVQGSCRQTMNDHFFRLVGILDKNIRFFDGKSEDLTRECADMDSFIEGNGRIDMLLLGIGLNGHLGFNEPGVNPDLYSHVTELDPITKQVSVKYFDPPQAVASGITLGLRHVMEARTVILLASGSHKAEIVRSAFHDQGSPTERIPASLLREHPNFHLCLDQSAAEQLITTNAKGD
ncbi:glucosamine-6-phosphate deaminase [Cohnella herbarum]|uniref:Glucosamine-6-phosphate deaminase n=1 Tax=Cohnella herbarum TaxID=2728023 RepID=A0A7Z2VN96_9BACL|nr:glucosamine-6-phosphate deaminase [Cohnella herbarum]QJD86202.1 glucosamine-6-phosphate deaminase [Cohnella herbarum]